MFETGDAPFTVLGRERCIERDSVGPSGNIPCDSVSFMIVEWTMGRPHWKVKSIQNLAGARGILKKVVNIPTYDRGKAVSPWADGREICNNNLDRRKKKEV